jgi:hypothetical protein
MNISPAEIAFWDMLKVVYLGLLALDRVRARLKEVYLGLLALDRVRARQRLRLTSIKHDGANTKLFYLWANDRKRKKAHIDPPDHARLGHHT